MHTTATSVGAIQRHFTTAEVDPLDAVEWNVRPAWKPNDPHYRSEVETPAHWSQTAVDIAAKLYLAKGGYREDSIRDMITRVSGKISEEGQEAGYFNSSGGQTFKTELEFLLVNQIASFNSPVWFNIGRPDRKQCPSACFLLGVEDTSESIMKWVRDEAFIFKAGAGSGVNVSNMRGSMEPLSPGGLASGPVSFMRLTDASNGTFKSGGVTRRGAALRACDDDHPDVLDFIQCKVKEEDRLRALANAGYDIGMSAEGERTVAETTAYQNANNSVRLSDRFMRKATGEDPATSWPLMARKKGVFEDDITGIVEAPSMLDEIAQAAHACADPGVQFHDTINSWHTTPNDAPIRTTNPCSEVCTPDNSACNLASINVLAFVNDDGSFDIEGFRHTVDVMITAMDILVEFCELPTDELTSRTKEYRWLGLGFANMGAAVMAQGFPYDSDEARDFAAAVTALMTGRAYRRSSDLAQAIGPFEGFKENREAMLRVIKMHLGALSSPGSVHVSSTARLWERAEEDWHDAQQSGVVHGYRNAQATVIAPTGSISFLMDCDTTGIEPCWNLVTQKDLAGGGTMKLVNQSVDRALRALGYGDKERGGFIAFLEQNDRLPYLTDAFDSVFAGANDISPEGHVRMVAAVQPFLSGSVSKTINVGSDATADEIRDLYVLAWRLGVKCMAVYRDGSKARQVLSSKPKDKLEILPATVSPNSGPHTPSIAPDEVELVDPSIPTAQTDHAEDAMEGPVGPERRRMPRDRNSLTHKFNLSGFEGYLIVGMYEDGTPGEIFIEDIGKEGSTLRGMMNAWAIQVSTSLQYGQPLEVMVRKYTNMCFEPHGRTECPEIPTAQSLPDYIMRWMALKFLPDMHSELGLLTAEEKKRRTAELDAREAFMQFTNNQTVGGDAGITISYSTNVSSNVNGRVGDQMCPSCGGLLQRTGTCMQCPRCAFSSGGCS